MEILYENYWDGVVRGDKWIVLILLIHFGKDRKSIS